MSDLISRQAAIDAICKSDCGSGFCGVPCQDVNALEALPSEQPKRKRGKWIKVNGKTAINCSACYHCSWSRSFEDTVKRFNFCPNCGADMRGEQE